MLWLLNVSADNTNENANANGADETNQRRPLGDSDFFMRILMHFNFVSFVHLNITWGQVESNALLLTPLLGPVCFFFSSFSYFVKSNAFSAYHNESFILGNQWLVDGYCFRWITLWISLLILCSIIPQLLNPQKQIMNCSIMFLKLYILQSPVITSLAWISIEMRILFKNENVEIKAKRASELNQKIGWVQNAFPPPQTQ